MGLIFETLQRDFLALILVTVTLFTTYVHHVYNIWKRKGLIYIKPEFPFGNFKDTMLQRKSFGQASNDLYMKHDAPVVGMWMALRPTLLIRDPEIVRLVCVRDFHIFSGRGVHCDSKKDPLSGHIVAENGEKWKILRDKLTPTFSSGKIRGMFSKLVECGGAMNVFLEKAADERRIIEVRELLAQLTTNVIASVAFGVEVDSIADPETPFRKFGRKTFEASFMSGLRFVFLVMFPKLMSWIGMKVVDDDVEDFFLNVVRKNMEYREKNHVTRKDFFQMLLQLRNTGTVQEDDNFGSTVTSEKKTLTIEECTAQAFVFFIAGFETTSTTMSFALYELAKSPKYMRKVQQEIDEVLAKHNGEINYDSMSDMKFLWCCISETMRMHPTVPILNRMAYDSWTIPNTNIKIDKGTSIIIPAHALHHDPKYYPDPETFMPERFSPEQMAKFTFNDRPYLPFGEGPRNCIGMRMGKMQSLVGLVMLLQKFDYELAGSTRLPLILSPTTFFLTPIDGINLKISHRQAV